MDSQNNQVTISGVGKINGGKYGNVEITGFGRIAGDIEAERIQISGAGTIDGNALIERLKVEGTGTVYGDAAIRYIESTGNLKISGMGEFKELVNEGRCRFEKDIVAEKIYTQWYFSSGGSVKAENFYSKGSLNIDGKLNASSVEIELGGFCTVKEIKGEDIYVRKQTKVNLSGISKYINPWLGKGRELDKLKCEEISGENVDIEYAEIGKVRGKKVLIGPECKIEEIEYEEELKKHPSAWIGRETKL